MVQACNISKHYFKHYNLLHAKDGFYALRDISFTVHAGDHVALIGDNGSGKSTLLKILSRVTRPSEGNLRVSGRLVSMLELGAGFHPDLTGEENVYFLGGLMGLSRTEINSKLHEIIRFSEMQDFMSMKVKSYSNGMIIRLALGVALTNKPKVILADEVFSVLDKGFKIKCIEKIERIKEIKNFTKKKIIKTIKIKTTSLT